MLRVGIIGCGGMGRLHARGYLACGRFEIVALADRHESVMVDLDTQCSISTRHFTDPREMLEEVRPDVVSVCTWHAGHPKWTVAAAACQPKAILCEKPMADTPGNAEIMLTACRRNGVKLAIAHQRRFLPAYNLARERIAAGAIGDVQLISSVGKDGLPNYSSHQTDMYRYLLGDDDCTWVMGNVERKTDRRERDTPIEDAAMGVFAFAGGAKALLLSDLTAEVYQGAKIYGSEGMIDLTTERLRLMSPKGGWEEIQPEGRWLQPDEPRYEMQEGCCSQADELADWVEGSVERHRGDAENGYQALLMVHAVYESARRHERLEMPLQTRLNPLELMIDSGHLAPERPGPYEIRAFLLRGEEMKRDADLEG